MNMTGEFVEGLGRIMMSFTYASTGIPEQVLIPVVSIVHFFRSVFTPSEEKSRVLLVQKCFEANAWYFSCWVLSCFVLQNKKTYVLAALFFFLA